MLRTSSGLIWQKIPFGIINKCNREIGLIVFEHGCQNGWPRERIRNVTSSYKLSMGELLQRPMKKSIDLRDYVCEIKDILEKETEEYNKIINEEYAAIRFKKKTKNESTK